MTSFTASDEGAPIRISVYINESLRIISDLLFVPSGGFDVSKTKMEFGPYEIRQNEDRLVNIFLADQFGNPLVDSIGGFVALNFSGGTSVIKLKSVVDNGDGSYSLLITGVKAGSSNNPQLRIGDQAHTFTGISMKVVP